MMTLDKASAYFDRTPALHPDNATVLFLCQVDPYDDSKRDAGAAYRRVLSVAAGTVIPSDRAVRIHGVVHLIGTREVDGWEDIHREKYTLQAAEQLTVRTASEHLAQSAGTYVWGGLEWIKDGKEVNSSSNVSSQLNCYLADGTQVSVPSFVSDGTRTYIARTIREVASGFTVVLVESMESGLVTADVTTRTYDPVAGGYTNASTQQVPCQIVRWQTLFEYRSEASPKFRPGDDTAILPAGTALGTDSSIVADGITYQVIDTYTAAGARIAHVRRI